MAQKVEKSISEQALANVNKPPSEVVTLAGGKSFVVNRMVTRETLQVKNDEPIYIRFVQPMIEPEKDEKGEVVVHAGMAAPWTAIVIDLTDDVEKDIVLNAVFKKAIQRSYTGDSYVGKSFAVMKFRPEGNKRYSQFDIRELAEATN